MRVANLPPPPVPTRDELAAAAAVLTQHGVALGRLSDGVFVLARGGGMLLGRAEGHEVVDLAAHLEQAALH